MKKLLLVLLFVFPLFAGNLALKSGFVAAHTEMMMDSTIDPMNSELHGNMSIEGDDLLTIKGKLWVELDLFTSDETDRDDHMDEAQEIQKFPIATYTVSSLTKNTDGSYTIHGTLDYHGENKPFMANAEITDKNGLITISATSKLLVSDFGIEMPCMVFMCVRDQVDIFAKAVLIRK